MALITCDNITLAYEGKVVVSGLNFQINAGDYLCIVGENGSGKTTLMRTLLRLHRPAEGVIALGDGLKINQMGYLPQQTGVQKDFPASVGEVVLSGCLNRCGLRPFYTAQEKKMAMDNLEKMGISHLSSVCYRELSGGQQQRVLLARALCAAQRVLLLDEPVAGLDPDAAAAMYGLIEKLNREENYTILMISHDRKAAVKYASHLLRLGKSPFFGSKKEYVAAYGEEVVV